jgi:hypothetical protein
MTLTEVRESLAEFAATFDASRVTTSTAASLLAEASRIERIAASLTARLAARAADSGSWRDTGARSAADHLATETGTSVTQAQQILDTGRRLDRLPEVAAAASTGDLSAPQLAAVTDAAALDPAAAPRLVSLAGRASLAELRDECARTKAAADRDAEARRARIHQARSLRTWTSPDGTAHLHLRNTAEVIAEVKAAIASDRETLFRAARAAGERERPDALDADALLAVVRRATAPAAATAPDGAPTSTGPGGPASPTGARRRPGTGAAKILVRVDLDTLLRGYPIGDETCEIAGAGPVPVTAVTDMVAAGGFLAGIVTHGQRLTGVAHLGRKPTAAQDTALEWLYPTCAAEGCGNRLHLEKDHRVPWADTKITLVDLLDRLCAHHHALKTHRQWALAEGHGTRPFVPPQDPRHPRNAKTTGRAPPV